MGGIGFFERSGMQGRLVQRCGNMRGKLEGGRKRWQDIAHQGRSGSQRSSGEWVQKTKGTPPAPLGSNT